MMSFNDLIFEEKMIFLSEHAGEILLNYRKKYDFSQQGLINKYFSSGDDKDGKLSTRQLQRYESAFSNNEDNKPKPKEPILQIIEKNMYDVVNEIFLREKYGEYRNIDGRDIAFHLDTMGLLDSFEAAIERVYSSYYFKEIVLKGATGSYTKEYYVNWIFENIKIALDDEMFSGSIEKDRPTRHDVYSADEEL